MNKLLVTAGIVLAIVVSMLVWVSIYFSSSFAVSSNREDNCKEMSGSPEKVAVTLLNELEGCHIVGRGSFKENVFIHIKCKSEQRESINQFVFGSKEACGAFKKLNSVEYIKLLLQNTLPPNKASHPTPKSGAAEL